ncbi:MAG: 5-formyltetrahydrofolate cyclo-ligase [Anaeromyxobacteraceae bacterium]
MRAEVIARRATLSQDAHAALSRAACERLLAHPLLREARTVALYAALGKELDPAGAADALLARGVRVVYPRLRAGERRMAFAACPRTALVVGPLKALEPPPDAPELDGAEVDVIVVPAVAFTPDGHRLGRGGGYYDATLAAAPRARRVGLAFDLQVVPALPREDHDATVDAVVTELRTLSPASGVPTR